MTFARSASPWILTAAALMLACSSDEGVRSDEASDEPTTVDTDAGAGGGSSAEQPDGNQNTGGSGAGGAGSETGGATSNPIQMPDGEPAAEPTTPVYLKASNTGAGDLFGISVAMSFDGTTLAVGANREASAATGVNGAQSDDSAPDSGAVYVYTNATGSWEQQAYLKASNAGMGDSFGTAVALSADGNTLAVGARFEASAARGIDGDEADDTAPDAGAVYVFVRDGDEWAQQAYVKASNTDEYDTFGISVALSADGNTMAVGAESEDSFATGVGGEQNDKSAVEAGAVYLFERDGSTWAQTEYLKASNSEALDHFGASVALSADGATLAVGAAFEDSAGSGVNGSQFDNTATARGAVYVFIQEDDSWRQQAYVKPGENNGYGYDNFGSAVSLSADGHTLAVGAAGDSSAATGVDGDATDSSAPFAGAAYVFRRDAAAWAQQAYVKAVNTDEADEFGHHLSLSADGSALAVGAAIEASLGDDVDDNSATAAGAAYLYRSDGASWAPQAFIKAPNADAGDRFGWSLALSEDGEFVAIGASREASSATGVAGSQSDDSAAQAGAMYVFGVSDLE